MRLCMWLVCGLVYEAHSHCYLRGQRWDERTRRNRYFFISFCHPGHRHAVGIKTARSIVTKALILSRKTTRKRTQPGPHWSSHDSLTPPRLMQKNNKGRDQSRTRSARKGTTGTGTTAMTSSLFSLRKCSC